MVSLWAEMTDFLKSLVFLWKVRPTGHAHQQPFTHPGSFCWFLMERYFLKSPCSDRWWFLDSDRGTPWPLVDPRLRLASMSSHCLDGPAVPHAILRCRCDTWAGQCCSLHPQGWRKQREGPGRPKTKNFSLIWVKKNTSAYMILTQNCGEFKIYSKLEKRSEFMLVLGLLGDIDWSNTTVYSFRANAAIIWQIVGVQFLIAMFSIFFVST